MHRPRCSTKPPKTRRSRVPSVRSRSTSMRAIDRKRTLGPAWRFWMPEPYTAVGLIPSVRGVRKREQIQRNLDHLAELIAAASWLSSLDLPVRLVLLPEGALQGFTDEVFDLDHATYARETAIDIPGPETRFLGELARHWKVFLMAQAKARHE